MTNSSEESRLSAFDAPEIIAVGPLSPPIASMAMREPPVMRAALGLSLGRDDFAAVIMTASRAQIVRQLQFAAVRAFLERGGLQRMVAAAHVPLGRRFFSLRDSHCGTFKAMSSIKIATISASSRRVRNPRRRWDRREPRLL